jgi:hypothetical protein
VFEGSSVSVTFAHGATHSVCFQEQLDLIVELRNACTFSLCNVPFCVLLGFSVFAESEVRFRVSDAWSLGGVMRLLGGN